MEPVTIRQRNRQRDDTTVARRGTPVEKHWHNVFLARDLFTLFSSFS